MGKVRTPPVFLALVDLFESKAEESCQAERKREPAEEFERCELGAQ
jgi:hypothetical protein